MFGAKNKKLVANRGLVVRCGYHLFNFSIFWNTLSYTSIPKGWYSLCLSQPVGKKACVIGGSGFVSAMLVKLLLEKGYAVNTTVKDQDNHRKVSHLIELQKFGDLKIFQADLTDEQSFDAPVEGCDFVFHVATPVNFASEDPENDIIKPAIGGVKNVLKSCVKAKSVKRVVLTSSAAAVSINTLNGTDLVMTEENWTDVEFLSTAQPPTWGYPASKTLAEKEAWKFAEENNIDLVTVVPSLMAGRSLTLEVPSSIDIATALLTGNEVLVNALKGMEMLRVQYQSHTWRMYVAGPHLCSRENQHQAVTFAVL